MDIYVNVAGWAASTGASQGFQLDASPSNNLTGSAAYNTYSSTKNGPNQGDETQFYVNATGTGATAQVNVSGEINASNGGSIATIGQSGWYNFAVDFAKGSGGYVQNTFSVSTLSGSQLGSYTATSLLPNNLLGGNNYGGWTSHKKK